MQETRRDPGPLTRGAFHLLALFISLVMLELLLAGVYTGLMGKTRLYVYDPVTAWNNKPLLKPDGHDKRRTDPQGHPRYTGAGLAAPASQVLLFGDSFAFGWCAHVDSSFGAVLGRRLVGAARPRGFVNYGVGNFGTDQSYLQYRRLARAAAPRVLVYLMYENDFGDNTQKLSGSRVRPSFRTRDGRHLEQVGFPEPWDRLRDVSYTAHFALYAIDLLRQRWQEPEPNPEALWRALMAAWAHEARSKGDSLMVVYHHHPLSPESVHREPLVRAHLAQLGVPYLYLNPLGEIKEQDVCPCRGLCDQGWDNFHWQTASQQRYGAQVADWIERTAVWQDAPGYVSSQKADEADMDRAAFPPWPSRAKPGGS